MDSGKKDYVIWLENHDANLNDVHFAMFFKTLNESFYCISLYFSKILLAGQCFKKKSNQLIISSWENKVHNIHNFWCARQISFCSILKPLISRKVTKRPGWARTCPGQQ